MCTEPEKETDSEFSHFMVIYSEGSILGYTRKNGAVNKFLMGTDPGWVRIPSIQQWLELPKREATRIRQRMQELFGRIPVYRIPRFIVY